MVRLETLDNGLTVALRHVPNKVVTLDAWINVGSANEPDELNGVSHFLEHMMFKGTPRYGVGELDKAIMSVGGVWNAGTSKDFTHYYVTVASPFFDRALDAIADMMRNALIDPAEFDREKDVILEEYRRKQDNPWGLLFDELYTAAFESGPYHNSVIGTFESVSSLRRDDMHAYYRAHYRPDNMMLCVVGDIGPDAALRAVDAAFRGFAAPPAGPPPPARATRYAAPGRRVITKDVLETYVALAFPAPGLDAPDYVHALDVASTILGDGRSSRLNRVLREERRLVNSVAAGFPTHRHDSLFYMALTLDEPNLDKALDAGIGTIRELAASPPSDAEMAKARRILRNSIQFGTETNTGQSGMIGYYHTLTGSNDFYDTYLDALDAVTADRVSDVARRYLTGEPVAIVLKPNGNRTENNPSPEA